MAFQKYLNPTNDFVFKRIFGTEKNKDILIHFLNDVVDSIHRKTDIVEVSFLKTVQEPDLAVKKQSLVDVLCTDQEGKRYIVEMQVATHAGFEKRAQYYASKAYSSQLLRGEEYDNLQEVLFIAITDYIVFPKKKGWLSTHIILDKKSHEHDLQDFHFTFIELPKFTKSLEDLTLMVDKWAYFFKHAHATTPSALAQLIQDMPVLAKAYHELECANYNEKELNSYEQVLKYRRDAKAAWKGATNKGIEEGIEEGIKKGIAKGRKEGIAKGRAKGKEEGRKEGKEEGKEEGRKEGISQTKRETVLNMRAANLSVHIIAQVTKLSDKEIEEICSRD